MTLNAPALAAPRLVGRAAELAALCRVLEDHGAPAVVLIEGEAGIGKTRLLSEFLAGATVLTAVGDCPPFREPQTLGPIVDAIRKATDTVADLELSPLAGALRPLFPEWADELPEAPEAAEDASAARHRLFRALAELLAAIEVSVLAIEDVHWADETTLEFLLFLAFRQPPQLSLVLTYRPDDIPAGSLLPRLTSRLPAGAAQLRLSLGLLDTTATSELVSSMLSGEQVSGTFAEFLHEHTEGLPLAIEEAIRLIADRSELTMRDGGWVRKSLDKIAVPASIRDAVLERAWRLDEAAQQVLSAAAVLASPAGETTLGVVCGLTGERLRAGLSAALGNGLLRADAHGRVSFRHMLAARAAYDAIPVPDRRAMHLRAARMLERNSRTPPAQLARHFYEAGEIVTWCGYAEQAAELAVASGDEATAIELFHDLVLQQMFDGAARVFDKLTFVALPEPARCLDRLRAALTTVIGQDLPLTEQAVWRTRLGRLITVLDDDWEGARTEFALALPHLDEHPLLAARCMSMLAFPLDSTTSAARHLEWLERARTMSEHPSLTRAQRLRLQVQRTSCLLMFGRNEGWTEAATLPADGATAKEGRTILFGHQNYGDAAIVWGRYAEASDWLARASELASARNYSRYVYNVGITLAHLDWFTGAWDGLADRARPLTDSLLTYPVQLEARLIVSLLAAAGGDAEAEEMLRSVLADQARLGRVIGLMEPGGALAWLCLNQGRAAEALAVSGELAAIVAAKSMWVTGADLVPAHAAALIATSRAEEARRYVTDFAAGVTGVASPAAQAALLLSRALLAESDGQHARAAQMFGAAADAWRALPRPYEALLATERRARCLFAVGEAAQARAILAEAHRELTALGATCAAERVARGLRSAGGRTRGPGAGRPGYGGQLSPRELDVVRLVVAGQTNRQIAESLFVSPRTVATHVDAAMRKLSVTSRTALAVAAMQNGIVAPGTP